MAFLDDGNRQDGTDAAIQNLHAATEGAILSASADNFEFAFE